MTPDGEDARIHELSKQARLDFLGISEDELRSREPGWFGTGPIRGSNELEALSEAQRWALLAAFNGDNTDWIHGNAYENGRGGYITTPAGRELAAALNGSTD